MSDASVQAGEHRALVERLFPSLGIETFEPIGGGWTCDTYEVNREWIVQLPRSTFAVEMLQKQIGMLPELAREVSPPVPVPELVSNDPVCMGYRKIEGVPFTQVGDAGVWPERLGRFLYDLHMVPPEFVGMRARAAAVVRAERRREAGVLRDHVLPLLAARERDIAARVIDGYLEDDRNWRFAPCLTHGDLGPEHILVAPSGDLVGVIDWEDASVGDPVWDFSWILHVEPGAGERALAAYGGAPDDRFRERARFSFVLMPWHEVVYGLESGRAEFVESGLDGVRDRLTLAY